MNLFDADNLQGAMALLEINWQFRASRVLMAAHQLGLSRRFLCSVPYTLAWVGLMLAIQENFPKNNWLFHLKTILIISCGLFGALFTMVLKYKC